MTPSAPPEHAAARHAAADRDRRQDEAELWLARLGLVGAVAVLLAARMLSLHGGQVVLPLVAWPLPTLCTLRRWTGLECPGCGLTRSLVALAHLDAVAAWQFNPAGVLLFVLALVHIPLAVGQEARRWAGRPPLRWLPLYRAMVVLWVSALVGQWLLRLVARAI